MGMDRTLYKLFIVALALFTLSEALLMVVQISDVIEQVRRGYSTRAVVYIATVLYLVSRFLLVLGALYWLPKTIKKFFPEVA